MDKLNEVVISSSDAECIARFYEAFGFEMPDNLKEAVDDFAEEQTIETQRRLTKCLTIGLTEIDDPTLNKLFKPVLDACHKSGCEMQFEDDIDEMLTKKPDKE